MRIFVHDVLLGLDEIGDSGLGNLCIEFLIDEGERGNKVSILKQVDQWFSIGKLLHLLYQSIITSKRSRLI